MSRRWDEECADDVAVIVRLFIAAHGSISYRRYFGGLNKILTQKQNHPDKLDFWPMHAHGQGETTVLLAV